MAHWAEVMPGRIHELRYEAMVADPETEIRALLDTVGMPFHPDCLKFHKSRTMVKTTSVRQVRTEICNSSVGAWQRHAEALAPLREGPGLK